MQSILIISTILAFGLSAFFRKLAVDKIHPYHMQIFSAAVYVALIPIWLHLVPKNSELNWHGIGYSIVTTFIHVCGAVMFGMLLRESNTTGMLTVMISASPTITVLLSILFLQEKFELKHALATLFVLAGLWLFSTK